MQELLSQCLEQYKDTQRRIEELQTRLRQYGYKGDYQGPILEDINEILNVADAHANVACTEVLLMTHVHLQIVIDLNLSAAPFYSS